MTSAVPSESSTSGWPWPVKLLASLLLLFHIVAMVVASYCSGPASPLAYAAYEVCGPYAQAMYVNHGYRFFSPEPGASTLLEFHTVLPDGQPHSEIMPDKHTIWPRVFYHRHFMLTEFMASIEDRPLLLEEVFRTYAANYLRNHPEAVHVTLVRVRHTLPTPEFILAGGTLDHESNFIREKIGTYRWNAVERTAEPIESDEDLLLPRRPEVGGRAAQAAGGLLPAPVPQPAAQDFQPGQLPGLRGMRLTDRPDTDGPGTDSTEETTATPSVNVNND